MTQFFRDLEAFQVLEATVIPELLAQAADQPLRVWVPGCATGRGPLDHMLLLEQLSALQSAVH